MQNNITRSISISAPSTLDEATRSIEVVAATETPSRVWDPVRWEEITEVLRMDQVEISESIPLTIEHERGAYSVIGSFRNMRTEGDKLVGRVYFSSDNDAEKYYIRVKEGHLKNFSVTYPADENRESVYVADKTTSEVNGRTYDGPILVTTKWRPKSLGLVLYPADENAKARSQSKQEVKKQMSNETEVKTETKETVVVDRAATQAEQKPVVNDEVIRAEAIQVERNRITEITDMCAKLNVGDLSQELIRSGASIDQARAKVIEHLAGKSRETAIPNGGATMVHDERDKYRDHAPDAIMYRSGIITKDKISPLAVDMSGFTLVELARRALRAANLKDTGDIRGVIGRAMTTSDFPYILANVANKSLFMGWETAEETWRTWCAVGSVSDFKTHYSPRLGEFSDLDEIPESAEYKYGERTEAQETYSITTYGKLGAITRQAIINDDLDAITTNMMGMGESAARKIGDLPYAVLTANAAMGDGTALFASGHSNLVAHGSGAAPGISTIAAGILAMGLQTDLSGLRKLNIRPQYFIGPKTLEGAAEIFFRTGNFSDHSTVATDSTFASTRVNPYSGNYFTRVYEARLDANDAAAWFLAATKGKTVKVFFLNGQQAPYFESQNGWTVDGTEFKVRIDAGAKAMDWRGLYMNDGN